MIHHVVYFQLKPEVDAAATEHLVRSCRSQMLRIPEVLSVRSGRNLDAASQWQVFLAIEVDSREKLRAALDDPHHLKFVEKHVKPVTASHFSMDFETDPSKDLKYS